MALDPKRWTTKTNEAVSSAMELATITGHPELSADHLIVALMQQTDTVIPALLSKLGVASSMLLQRAQDLLNKLPKTQGGSEPRMNRELANVFTNAEKTRGDLRDDYLSVEHLLLAMNQRVGATTEEMLQSLRDVRGSSCDEPEPRRTVPST